MNLIKSNNPKLKKVSEPVENIGKAITFSKNLLHVLGKTKNGVGLAAVQVGYLKRMFVIQWAGKSMIIINPTIVKYSFKKVKTKEGCLSYPNIFVTVKRSFWIDVTYTDGKAKLVEERLLGMDARVFQHEYDHLDGVCKVGDNTK